MALVNFCRKMNPPPSTVVKLFFEHSTTYRRRWQGEWDQVVREFEREPFPWTCTLSVTPWMIQDRPDLVQEAKGRLARLGVTLVASW